MSGLTDSQRATLRAVCDTVVPAIERADDPDGFWARKATDVGADAALLLTLERLPPDQAAGMLRLLDTLARLGFDGLSQLSREQLFTNVSLAPRDASYGLSVLVALTLIFTYAGVDPRTGRNPFWATFGYPGPLAPPPGRTRCAPRTGCASSGPVSTA